jgi:predicted kinase
VAIGGFSGSGKSTLARGLAADVGGPPGAVVLRSDEVRKRICGKAPLDRLSPEGYTPEVSERVYAALAAQARAVVRAGYGAVADAVYAQPAARAVIERVALDAGVSFTGLWLDAPDSILIDRLRSRVADASDADAAVLRMQQTRGAGQITWLRIDASGSPDAMMNAALSHIGAPAAAE